MSLLTFIVNIKGRDFDFPFHRIAIDAHNSTLVLIDLLLVAISRFGDLTLEKAILDTGKYTAQSINALQVVHCSLLGLIGQRLDKVGATQGIDGIGNAALAGDDLLGT